MFLYVTNIFTCKPLSRFGYVLTPSQSNKCMGDVYERIRAAPWVSDLTLLSEPLLLGSAPGNAPTGHIANTSASPLLSVSVERSIIDSEAVSESTKITGAGSLGMTRVAFRGIGGVRISLSCMGAEHQGLRKSQYIRDQLEKRPALRPLVSKRTHFLVHTF